MKFLLNRFLALLLSLGIVLFSSGLPACARSENASNKGRFTKADLEKLKWIEGAWRGTDKNGQNPFFERYRITDDGKIETDSFSDSTLTKTNSQSSTYFENGEIIHRSGAVVWTASRLDDSMVEFAPKENATNSFVWQKESVDVWTARLMSKDAQGAPKETTYRMERIKQ